MTRSALRLGLPWLPLLWVGCVQILGADKDYVLGDIGTGGAAGDGGTAGAGGDGGATCGSAPTPPGGACPSECNGGCDGDVCVIDCAAGSCAATITCPPGFACEVRCTSMQACRDATIQCPDTYACQVVCDGVMGCRDSTLACADGPCDVDCGSGCTGMEVSCGPNACTASCSAAAMPTLDCAASCMCEGC